MTTLTVSAREQFIAALGTVPRTTADAIVIFCGEDTEFRIAVGYELFKMGAAPIIAVSGGMHQPPRWRGAQSVYEDLMGKYSVAPSRLVADCTAQNTHEQATNLIAMAERNDWRRLILVASSYHLPRAFLSCLASMTAEQRDSMRVIPVGTAAAPWFAAPQGMTETRIELFDVEMAKIEIYHALGHVASFEEGLHYLAEWEAKS